MKEKNYYSSLLNRKKEIKDSFMYKYIIMNTINENPNTKEIESIIKKVFLNYEFKLWLSKRYPVQNIKSCGECQYYLYNEYLYKNKAIVIEHNKQKICYEKFNLNYDKPNYCSYCFFFLNSFTGHIHNNFKYIKLTQLLDNFTYNIAKYVISNKLDINQNLTNLLSDNFITLANAFLLYDDSFNKSKYFIAPLLNDYYVHNTFLFIDNITHNLPNKICLVYKEDEFKNSPIYNLLTCDDVKTFNFKDGYLGVILPVSFINNFENLFKAIINFENGILHSRYSQLNETIKNKILSFYYPHKILLTIMNSILNVSDEDISLFLLINDLNLDEIHIKKVGEIFSVINYEKELIKVNY
ncbi:MAG: hypothetical protein N3A01_09315 [Bacteroidales bacterium]|nr:hypothetical protein [Bacteroidales bacterium]